MKGEKPCRFCAGTGIIHCTTGKDGEMAVSCSCRTKEKESPEPLKPFLLLANEMTR